MATRRVKKPVIDDRRPIREPKALADYQMEVVGAPWYGEDGKALIHTLEKARRIGGSEAAAIRGLGFLLGRRLLYDRDRPDEIGDFVQEIPMSGIVVAQHYRGSKMLLAKIAENIRELADAGDADCIATVSHCHETKIYCPTTGTEVKAVACSPTTIRGSTGFVLFDEFAFARQQEDCWGAAKIVTDPNLGRPSGYPLLVITTPWEAGSFAHRIFTDPNFPFSNNRFRVDIYRAVRDGFPIDIHKAFAELGIPELIETEYKCKWSRGGESFFSLDKLRAICVDDDREGLSEDDVGLISGLPMGWQYAPCRIGIDCGGGVGRDFTAVVMWRLIAGRWWMVGCKASNLIGTVDMADKTAEWLLDKSIVDSTVQIDVRCDRGVMGADFIRQLVKRLKDRPRTNVIGVGMTMAEQELYALAGRRLLERGQMAIYLGMDAVGQHAENADYEGNGANPLMMELGRIKARLGQGGHLAFVTPRDPLRGHCDRGWASLMGLDGADSGLITSDVSNTLKQLLDRLTDAESIWGKMGAESRGYG